MRFLTLTLIFLTLTSCALAPFGPTTTGRSYGKGKMFAAVGNSNSTYHLKFGLGVSEDLDFGYVMEFGPISTSAIYLKYAVINNSVGPALGFEFGFGSTETTEIMYLGSTGSLAFTEQLEIFTNLRVNKVVTDETDIEKDEFNGNVKILAYDLTYFQFTYGLNLFFSGSAGISIYSTYYKGNDLETLEDSVFGTSLLFKF